MEKKFALIGHPIHHSLSPYVHTKLSALLGATLVYKIIDTEHHDLSSIIRDLRLLDGYNVTIPHKQNIVRFLTKLSDTASLYNSVNTVYRGIGYNTDILGFLDALRINNTELAGRISIIGYGGTAIPIIYEALTRQCEINVLVRKSSMLNASLICGNIQKAVGSGCVNVQSTEFISGTKKIDLLINATPCGSFPDTHSIPVNSAIFEQCSVAFDVIYNPVKTLFLNEASKHGCRTISGIHMLVCQAAKSQSIWTGSQFTDKDIKEVCIKTELEIKRRNNLQ